MMLAKLVIFSAISIIHVSNLIIKIINSKSLPKMNLLSISKPRSNYYYYSPERSEEHLKLPMISLVS